MLSHSSLKLCVCVWNAFNATYLSFIGNEFQQFQHQMRALSLSRYGPCRNLFQVERQLAKNSFPLNKRRLDSTRIDSTRSINTPTCLHVNVNTHKFVHIDISFIFIVVEYGTIYASIIITHKIHLYCDKFECICSHVLHVLLLFIRFKKKNKIKMRIHLFFIEKKNIIEFNCINFVFVFT